MLKHVSDAPFHYLVGGILIAAILAWALATTADARRARNAVRGAAIGAGAGALVNGGRGARTGAVAGALVGATRR